MRQRFLIIVLLFLGTVLQTSAQALTDRYNKQRPLIVVCNNDHYIEITKAVTNALDLPCQFIIKDEDEAKKAFEQGDADLIITNAGNCRMPNRITSKSIIHYSRLSSDTIAEIRYVSNDRQLIEQMDDEYMRMKQNGDIAAIEKRWEHPELAKPQNETTAITITDSLLVLSAILFLIALILLWHIRATRRHTAEISEMMTQTKQMSHYYAIEDNQAAHDLEQKYKTILCNPFLAIAFYDKDGQLIVENDAMKQSGHQHTADDRQPLYNAEGQITNYLVAIRRPATTT